jgi:hypothetical protein
VREAVAKKAHVWARDPLEWYVEELRATEQLLEVERFIGGIWDPCCGQGNILEVALKAGYAVVGTDVVKRRDRDFIQGGVDFLEQTEPRAPNVVMNPPFFRGKGTEAFIRKALALVSGKVAAFVDLKFLAGAGRANGLWNEFPPHRIWIVTPRVSCPPGEWLAAGNKAGGGTADWCWAVWDRTAPRVDSPAMGWLRRAA